ncbi:S1 family peptidase [Alteromonas sp. AMM-1]|uniref:S1 family peptidase n=1 Tax=Alteromonas sp. AMM-1 TaxID=3394233 RepID=UPI0039A7630A
MKKLVVMLISLILLGCEATPVQNAAQVKTKSKLNANIQLPLDVTAAFYVDKSTPERKINFYGKLEEATELVMKDFFTSSEQLTSSSNFDYLIQLGAVSDWDYVWGGYESDLELVIKNRSGDTVFKRQVQSSASGTGGVYDFNAVYNAFVKSVKELLIEFVNSQERNLVATAAESATPITIKAFFDDMSPAGSGTGFYIDKNGTLVTAAHVVSECILVEVKHKGQTYAANIAKSSELLDLAVLTTDYQNPQSISIRDELEVTLGKPLFATGFPLSNLLSDYPSLTVGNVTSQGGLKGARGSFQFSAPVQPGNSGGAVVDYSGQLLGVVSGSLNQRMMLNSAGTTSQNVNFAIGTSLLAKFLTKGGFSFSTSEPAPNFEEASKLAVEYTNQVLCYK